MAAVTELVTKFGFQGSTDPLSRYNSLLGGATAGLAAVSAALVTATAGVVAFGNSSLRSLNPLVQLSRNSGVAAADINSLDFAARSTGAGVGVMQGTLESLNRTIGDANISGLSNEFLELGIGSVRKSNGELKTSQELFLEIGGQLRQLSRIEQVSFAGRLGIDDSLLDLLNLSSQELASLRREAETYGKITQDQSEGIIRYNNSINRIQASFGVLRNTLAVGMLPILESFADATGNFIRNNGERFSNILGSISDNTQSLTGYLKVFTGIVAFAAGSRVLGMLLKVLNPIRIGIMLLAFAIEDLYVGMTGGASVIRDFFNEMFGYDITGLGEDFMYVARIVGDVLGGAFDALRLIVQSTIGSIEKVFSLTRRLIVDPAFKAIGEARGPSADTQFLTDEAILRMQQRNIQVPSAGNVTYNMEVKQDISTSNPERAAQAAVDRFDDTLNKTTRQQQRAVEGG